MRAVPVHQHAGIVVVVVSVAGDVRALVTDEHFLSGDTGESLGQHAAGEACSDNEVIEHRTPQGWAGARGPAPFENAAGWRRRAGRLVAALNLRKASR